jgi:two-component system chemotaxis response regulator CheB
MLTRVLIVDDSPFFRHCIKMMLSNDQRFEVVGEAENGAEAVMMVARLKPDVITMDIEMPVMDGIAATRRIMQSAPRPILMFSSLTTDGAKATLAALEAGAVDYLPKHFEDLSRNRDKAAMMLCERIYTIARRGSANRSAAALKVAANDHAAVPSPGTVPQRSTLKLVAIGTSTGGPLALEEVLSRLPASFPYPVLLVQHMPGSFTPAFAQRLNQLCAITVKEAEDGDELAPATALLAPGGKQMLLKRQGGRHRIHIRDAAPEQIYRPSVNLTFHSIAKVFPGQTLALILTGMGDDGLEGCRSLKSGGSTVWTQDEASCVVYGMPAAVADAGLSDRVLSLAELAGALRRL